MMGLANDCQEIEHLINRSIEKMKEKLPESAIDDFLQDLNERLSELSPSGFGYLHWCNICCAILFLGKLTNK